MPVEKAIIKIGSDLFLKTSPTSHHEKEEKKWKKC